MTKDREAQSQTPSRKVAQSDGSIGRMALLIVLVGVVFVGGIMAFHYSRGRGLLGDATISIKEEKAKPNAATGK